MTEEILIERVKQALKRASENVKATPLALPEKIRVVDTLVNARFRLGSVVQRPADMHTSVLMVHLNKKTYADVKAVLEANPPLQLLYQFGSVQWVFIEAVFRAAGVDCPLELESFHKAYQEELQTLS